MPHNKLSAKSAAVVALITLIISYITSIGFTAMLTNHYSTDQYAYYALGAYILAIISPIILRGAGNSILTYLGGYLANDTTKKSQLIGWQLKIIICATIAFIILLTLTMLGIYLIDPTFYTGHYPFIFAYLTLMPFIAMQTICSNILISSKSYIPYYLASSILPQLITIGCLFTLIFLYGAPTLNALIISLWIGYIITICMQIICIKYYTDTGNIFTYWKVTLEKENIKTWRKYSVKLFFNLEIAALGGSLPALILSLFSNNITNVGTYSIITAIASILLLIRNSLSQILTSYISADITSKEGIKKIQSVINLINALQTALGIIFITVLIFYKTAILSYFGADYAQYANILLIYSCIIFVMILFANSTTILNNSGHTEYNIYINLSYAIGLAIFGSITSYFYGLNGILFTSAILTLCCRIVTSILVRRLFGLKMIPLL